ncbi:FAD binding domain protein [Aspergillus campestris IBT 28561]|uniref:FAD binding domain protein n=1 Tax=Aspergillus campestris (strain IBT 28561) TaxID=1392248 RepID=A0A2I1D543_ASPC2|nr:FAD binding domain protein [Aspergillus campestris IBT 28561]PKY04996.1 FAD binding domain protein [Aspergillus campestris IBT 28561]
MLIAPFMLAMALGTNPNIPALFSPVLSPGAEICLPSDKVCGPVISRWSTFKTPSYIATIKPATEEDVQKIVQTATKAELPFFVTGGGHGVSMRFSAVRDAINIDLSNLKSVQVDLAGSLVTIGSGVENAQLYDLLASLRKETPLTTERCINTVGTTIGGGLGPLYGIHGLTLDALLSVRLVTAAGELLTVSPHENPNLFWAIRGAGANFGVVTSARYRIYDETNAGNRIQAIFQFAPIGNLSVFELLQSWDDHIPPELFLGVHLSYDQTSRKPTITMKFDFTGRKEAAQQYLDQIQGLNPIYQSIETIPWHNNQSPDPPECERGKYTSLCSFGLHRTDPIALSEYLHNLTEFAAARPWLNATLMWQRLSPGFVTTVPENHRGVYPWRDTKVNVGLSATYPGPEYDDIVNDFVRRARERLNEAMGYAGLHVYVNQAIGDEGPAAWYGEKNLERLGALKHQWDPSHHFGASAPITSRSD